MSGFYVILVAAGFITVVACSPKYAACVMQSEPGQEKIYGTVKFAQLDARSPLHVDIKLEGFPKDKTGKQGIHIHELGDITDGCKSTKGHFNPDGTEHGAPTDQIRHIGDFGNHEVRNKCIVTKFPDMKASLFGCDSIIGRAVVLHAGEDDLGKGGNPGSKLHGNAGARVACCVIGISSPWNAPFSQPQARSADEDNVKDHKV